MFDRTSWGPERRGLLSLLAFILALGIPLALGAPGDTLGAPRPAASDRELLILSTTSNRGEVDPCG